jgi:hypothetical protein
MRSMAVIYRAWAQSIATGHLRDPKAADKAAATAQRYANTAHEEHTPIGAEVEATLA